MRVSMDFDDTLTEDGVWQYALELIDRGVDVWIVTARLNDENALEKYGRMKGNKLVLPSWAGNEEVYEMAAAMKIPKDQIVFSNLLGKGQFFSENGDFVWHLDDSIQQLWDIRYKSSVPPISVLNPDWKNKCNKLIKARDPQHYLK